MTPSRKIKVRMTVTVELDPTEWADEYGCEPSEVRDDVRSYFLNQIVQSAAVGVAVIGGALVAVEDASLTVRVA